MGNIEKIRQFMGYLGQKIGQVFSYNAGLSWMTHISAEHMSQGILAGNFISIAGNKFITFITKNFNDVSKFQEIAKQLTYAEEIRKAHNSSLNVITNAAENRVKKDIKHLEVNESLLIPRP